MNSQQLISIICDEVEWRQISMKKCQKEDDEEGKGDESTFHISDHKGKRCHTDHVTKPWKICKQTNHTTADCRYKGKPKCGYCRKFGHSTDDCWLKKKGKERDRDRDKPLKQERANMAHHRNRMNIDTWNTAGPSNTANVVEDSYNSDFSCYWLADTATTCHISYQRNVLTDFINSRENINGIGESPAKSLG
jgi:hypothetical protein